MDKDKYLKSVDKQLEYYDEVIFDRGLDYFNGKMVDEVKKVNKNKITAIVYGSDDYNVIVESKNNEVIYTECDCPYACGGNGCKHEVATLLYIKNNYDDIKTVKEIKKEYEEKEKYLSDCIDKIKYEDLKEYLIMQAEECDFIYDDIVLMATENSNYNDFIKRMKDFHYKKLD